MQSDARDFQLLKTTPMGSNQNNSDMMTSMGANLVKSFGTAQSNI